MNRYRVNLRVRLINLLMRGLIGLGLPPRHSYLLMVTGRKTGALYSTPVTLVEDEGGRWLVAPYGEVGWVRNARASREVVLKRGGRTERVGIVPARPGESGPVLKKYLALEPVTRPYFDAGPDSPPQAFEAEASRHPVFRITAHGASPT